jgi:hypothetical protein
VSEIKFHSPSQILTESDALNDIRIMTGYTWSVGAEGGVFPSEHFIELNEYYFQKHVKPLRDEIDKLNNLYDNLWVKCGDGDA